MENKKITYKWKEFLSFTTFITSLLIVIALFVNVDLDNITEGIVGIQNTNITGTELYDIIYYSRIIFILYFVIGIASYFDIKYFFVILTILTFNPIIWIYNIFYIIKKQKEENKLSS
jgi:hypothetical protein